MSLWLSIVTRATGLPDKRYLNDPVILRYYQQKIQKAPYAPGGMDSLFHGNHWCVAGTGSFQPDVTSRSADIDLSDGGAPWGGTSSCIRKDVSMPNFYQTVLDDASVSDIQKAQFEYLFVTKVDELTIGDLYRLYDFNRGGR
uniref:hypothetical protein n=1 Tax=Escherichia coli TaxID=562 RepID=UPI001F4309C2|nr:hypothetical protein [Escherichia coli]UGK56370.1 hypothetical protein [Escherichia coli]